MRRREFIVVFGGAPVWPLAARVQQPERKRRIGALMPYAANNPQVQPRIAALMQELQKLGWTDGRDVRIEYRWADNADEIRKYAAELVALGPDVILTAGVPAFETVLQATRTVPIVFVIFPDPVGAGYATSLARPGANATGLLTMYPAYRNSELSLTAAA